MDPKDKLNRRVSLICIKNKKILMTYKPEVGAYFTPGGRVEIGEDSIESLRKEIREKLDCEIENVKFFKTFRGTNDTKGEVFYQMSYFADVVGKMKPRNGVTKVKWIDKHAKGTPIRPMMKDKIIPALVKRKLL